MVKDKDKSLRTAGLSMIVITLVVANIELFRGLLLPILTNVPTKSESAQTIGINHCDTPNPKDDRQI